MSPLRVVRLGAPRQADEGLRLGTVRRQPRGVLREHCAIRDYFDLWLPELAPSSELLSWVNTAPLSEQRWRIFVRRYCSEMRKPEARRLIALLAAVSSRQNLSVGCYCKDEFRCHRALLRQLLRDAGAVVLEE